LPDFVRKCEQGLRPRLDPAIQEAPERIQGFADVGRRTQNALDSSGLPAGTENSDASRVAANTSGTISSSQRNAAVTSTGAAADRSTGLKPTQTLELERAAGTAAPPARF
jgi:hypothetical protein